MPQSDPGQVTVWAHILFPAAAMPAEKVTSQTLPPSYPFLPEATQPELLLWMHLNPAGLAEIYSPPS